MNFSARTPRVFLLILAAVIAVLAVLWFGFLRTSYVPVYQNIREADASAIVTELEAAGIPFRLSNEGHDILVPDDQVAQARVAVAGSEIALGGTVGFELFNDSDMGLTEFAQKINFQRAMQGELARSIMMMDGIAFARVHLAIPERSIFRSGQGTPTAAVTLEMSAGTPLSQQRIRGIQQLVASSVPGLASTDVAILDSSGDLVSANIASAQGGVAGPISERAALEGFYAAKARAAIERVLPGLSFDVELTARPPSPVAIDPAAEGSAPASSQNDRAAPSREGLIVRVLVRTPVELGVDERNVIQSALVSELDLAEGRGDILAFSTGALASSLPDTVPSTGRPAPAPVSPIATDTGWSAQTGSLLSSKWTWIALLALFLTAVVAWPRRRLPDEEAASFAELLKSTALDRADR